MVLGEDGNAVSLEQIQCVFGKVLIEHGENFGRDVVDGYFDVWHECWIQLSEVFMA